MNKELEANTTISHYRILQKLGAGGMGEVYLAKDTKLERLVALKLLPEGVASDAERMRRFVQEAKAAAALNHPSIAHIYEIGEAEDGTRFIAMEYVDGATLREKIYAEKTPLKKLLAYLLQVAEGLAKAHAAGIVHRDLKPDNIMISADGYAKILDFGLAKLVEPQTASDKLSDSTGESETAILPQHSTPGMILGTLGYMSPEQAQGRVREIDHRSDIFSFGCILYEAATGRRAFEGADVLDSLHRIVHAPTPRIKDANPLAPAELQRIVRRCLAKDPERRYQSIKEVAIELEELLEQLKGEAETDQFAPPNATGAAATVTQATASGAGATGLEAPRSSSSAEYLIGGIGRHKKGVFIALAALAVAAASLGYGLYRLLGHRASGLQSIKIVRLTNNGKVRETASVSTDGKYVAYSAVDDAGQSSIWVRHVATTSNVQIVPPAGADVELTGPVFSPDGNYVYYIRRERSAPGVLYQVPVLGGTSKKLLDRASNPVGFSPDGRRFAFVRRYTELSEDAIMLANADGTGEQKLTTLKHPDYFIGGLAWSPDGKTIACPMGGFTGGYYRGVNVIQVADGTQKPLTSHRWSNVEKAAWLADGSGVIVTAQEQAAAPFQIWYVSYPAGDVRPITNDLNSYRNASLTADSTTIVTVLFDITSNITVTPNGAWNDTRQITSGKSNGGAEGRVTWTPDGRIVYSSRAGGNPDIWIMDADGRNQKQLTDDPEYERAFSVTTDGRHIVFDSDRSGTLQIWRIDIDGGNLRQITNGAGAFQPSCSPDGKWVAYTTFGSGGFNIWRSPIDGGAPVQVTSKVSRLPSVSPDGKLIACYYNDEQSHAEKIGLVPFDGGEPVKLFDISQTSIRAQALRWTPDGRALTYIVSRGLLSNIWAQPVEGGVPKQLTDFKTDRIFSFDWSRDGRQLACSRGIIDSDVVLIKDFK